MHGLPQSRYKHSSNAPARALGGSHYRFLFTGAILFVIALALLAGGPLGSRAVSTTIVISQVYGGGGNSGAVYKNDFIELYNLGTATVDLTGWSVQYTSASGSAWQVTNLSGSIAPGHYYLVQEAQGGSGTTNLPTPDAFGIISMSSTGAKVALVSSNTALSGTCPQGAPILDFVGYGGASCFEGSGAAQTLSNTTADFRINSGCTDTDNNFADFAAGTPNPRNSAAPAVTCGVSPSPSPTPTSSPPPGCGVERWSIKTGTDGDADLVDYSSSQATTIATMRSWPAPSTIPANNRVAPYETTVWTVNATLVEYKLETDSDYHIVIRDDAGNTIVTEIPYPGCVGQSSPFAVGIANARAKFNAVFTPTSSFQFAEVPVQITGVGMFDFLHGQTGGAPNGIEIHPILDISFPSLPIYLIRDESGPAPDQAAALDSVLFLRDPFPVVNDAAFFSQASDRNTRVIVFVTNFQLAQGESASSVVVNLVDGNSQTFDVAAEDVRSVPDSQFTQVVFRLPDNLSPGTCTIKMKARGQVSDSGSIRIRQ